MNFTQLYREFLQNRPALLLASDKNFLHKRFNQSNAVAAVALVGSTIGNVIDCDWYTAISFLLGLVLLGVFQRMSSSGRIDIAAAGVVWTMFAVCLFSMRDDQGPFNPAILAFPTLIMAAMMLTSKRNVQALVFAMILSVGVMVFVSATGLHTFQMPQPEGTDFVYLAILLIAFAIISSLMASDLRHALKALVGEIDRVKLSEQHLDHLANHDQLTGLPNRRLLQDRIERAIAGFHRHKDHSALMFLDLDDFKNVNDTQGHAAGDALLIQVASRLVSQLRETDTVSRFGGDEFVLLVEGLGLMESMAVSSAHVLAEKVLESLRQPILLDGREFVCTTSMGLVLIGSEIADADSAIKQGDVAMYRAKSLGRNCVQFFSPDMQSAIDSNSKMENDLRLALDGGNIAIFLQPQVDSDNRVLGAEVLARWKHPQLGFVPPGEFIALAEKTGLIGQLGHQVFESSCRVLSQWSLDPISASWNLAVNVSMHQFREETFVDKVLSTIERYGVNPERLELEITESALVEDVDETTGKMASLRSCGIRFALDDFGTGYSSLSYLRKLPLDKLKIDQSFVRHVQANMEDAAIARTVISLAQHLGLSLIAEGVETQGQRDFLFASGCFAYQGYLYGKPMPVEEFHGRFCVTPNSL